MRQSAICALGALVIAVVSGGCSLMSDQQQAEFLTEGERETIEAMAYADALTGRSRPGSAFESDSAHDYYTDVFTRLMAGRIGAPPD